uniref:Uncharacterized protein n=1 Tax=viral metagenome TaxID=1070528 RepID=A0A6M3KWS6_9ZZZZ
MKKTFMLYGICIISILTLWSVAAYGDTQERVAPPADSGKMHFSIVGEKGDSQYENVKSLFYSNEDLAAFRKGVYFHEVESGTAIYRERYQPNVSGLPTIRLQLPDGVVVYERAGANVPSSVLAMKLELEFACAVGDVSWRCNPWKRCRPQPAPVEPQPEEPPVIEPFVPIEQEQSDNSWLLTLAICLSCVAGAVGGVVYEWKHPKKKGKSSWQLLF